MTLEFRQWLSTKVTPIRYQMLMSAMEVIIALNGVNMMDIENYRWSEIGIRDDSAIVDDFNNDCMCNLLALLAKFEITLNEDVITDNHMALLTSMLSALIDLDQYELPQDIITIIDDGVMVDHTMADLFSMMTGVDSITYLELGMVVSPALLVALRTSAVDKLDRMTEVDLEVPDTALLDSFRLVVSKVGLSDIDPIVHHFKSTGKLGLDMEAYISVLSDDLVNDVPEVLAKRWVLLTVASGTTPEAIATVFELVYIGDIKKLMAVNRIYKKLMVELQ